MYTKVHTLQCQRIKLRFANGFRVAKSQVSHTCVNLNCDNMQRKIDYEISRPNLES